MRSIDELHRDLSRASAALDGELLAQIAVEAKEHGTVEGNALSLRARADLSRKANELDRAMEEAKQSLILFEQVGNPVYIGQAHSILGLIANLTGNLVDSLKYHAQSVHFLERTNYSGLATALRNYAFANAILGNFAKAVDGYSRARIMFVERGDRFAEAVSIGSIGILHFNVGNNAQALNDFQEALSIHEDLHNTDDVARVTGNIGNVHWKEGDLESALQWFDKAIDLWKPDGNQGYLVHVLLNKTEVLIDMGRNDEAREVLEYVETFKSKEPNLIANTLSAFARLRDLDGDHLGAHDLFTKALDTLNAVGLKYDTVEVHESLRDNAQKRNDFAAYVHHNDEVLRIKGEINATDAAQKLATIEAERRIEAELRERDKERALLHGALPKAIADRMLRGEKVNGDHHPNSCVLFLDIVGFTTLSDTMPPNEVVSILGEVFSTMDSITSAHNVTKIKTIGDSYMAVAF